MSDLKDFIASANAELGDNTAIIIDENRKIDNFDAINP